MAGIAGVARTGPDRPLEVQLVHQLRNAVRDPGTPTVSEHDEIDLAIAVGNRSVNPGLVTTSTLVVSADARIDNRRDVAAALGGLAEGLSDVALISAAWQRWGPSCLGRFVGDFSLAVWDRESGRLTIARDFPGVRPLFWWRSGNRIAVGPSPSVILALPFVSVRVDDLAVGRYLMARGQTAEGTYFEGISRVLPGCAMEFTETGTRQISFFRLSTDENDPGSFSVAVEGFKDRFLGAVRARIEGATDIACELSGGLDSASVAGAIRSISPATSFPTFSVGFPDEERDLHFASRFADWSDIHNEVVDTSLIWDRRRNQDLFGEPGSPTTVDGPLFQGAMMLAACSHGTKTLLTGVDGDATALHGYSHITELFLARDFGAVAEAIAQVQRAMGTKKSSLLKAHAFGALLPPNALNLYAYWRGRPSTVHEPLPSHDLRRATRRNLDSGWRAPDRSGHFARDRHIETLTEPGVAEFLEVLDLTSRRQGIDLRHPYYDRRLIEWSVSMPARYKLEGGWTRAIQRHALRNLVPDWLRWRKDKGRVGDRFFGKIASAQWGEITRLVRQDGGAATAYLDVPALQKMYRRAAGSQEAQDARHLYSLMRLEWWLSAWR